MDADAAPDAAGTVTVPADVWENTRWQLETLLEDAAEAASAQASRILAADDYGWGPLTGDTATIGRDSLIAVSRSARMMVAADPLIARGVSLRVAYLGAPTISADDPDVNEVIQNFLDDPGNLEVFSSAQAAQERERARATDGNTFHALVTSARTGRVQVRRIPWMEVMDIVTDPEDTARPWLYLREYRTRTFTGVQGGAAVGWVTRKEYYPDAAWRPVTRPRSVDGIPVRWDTPVIHTAVNRLEGSRWGVPDVLAALPWARGYKTALEDWAKHHKALASIVFRASVKGRRQAAAVRAQLPIGDGDSAGRTVVQGPEASFDVVRTASAALPSDAAQPLAGMVAAALNVPLTMLLADPGTTGARAVAETLDRPLELERTARRDLDAGFIRQVLAHVIREAVRAPAGPLRGTVIRDPETGEETVKLTGDVDLGLLVDWPPLGKTSMVEMMGALATADSMDKVPPLVLARLVLVTLGVDDPDEVLAGVTGPDGEFIPPSAGVLDRLARMAGMDDADVPGE